MPKVPQASSWTVFKNALSGSSKLTDTRCMETVELEVRSGLGTGNGGLSEDQLSITATRLPEANIECVGECVFAQGLISSAISVAAGIRANVHLCNRGIEQGFRLRLNALL